MKVNLEPVFRIIKESPRAIPDIALSYAESLRMILRRGAFDPNWENRFANKMGSAQFYAHLNGLNDLGRDTVMDRLVQLGLDSRPFIYLEHSIK